MRKLLVIVAVVLTAAACHIAGNVDGTHSVIWGTGDAPAPAEKEK